MATGPANNLEFRSIQGIGILDPIGEAIGIPVCPERYLIQFQDMTLSALDVAQLSECPRECPAPFGVDRPRNGIFGVVIDHFCPRAAVCSMSITGSGIIEATQVAIRHNITVTGS